MRSPRRSYRRSFCWVAGVLVVVGASFGQVIDDNVVRAKLSIRNSLDLAIFRQTLLADDLLKSVEEALASGGSCTRLDFMPLTGSQTTRQQRLYRTQAQLHTRGSDKVVEVTYFHGGHPHFLGDQLVTTMGQLLPAVSAGAPSPFLTTHAQLSHMKTVFSAADPLICSVLDSIATGPGLLGLSLRSATHSGLHHVYLGVHSVVNGQMARLFWIHGMYGADNLLQGSLQITP